MNGKNINRISLALNFLLALICVRLAFQHTANSSSAAPPQVPQSESSSLNSQNSASGKNTPFSAQPGNWIEVLRNQDVPEKTIARLAIADFDDRWQNRQAATQEAYNRGDMNSDDLAALAHEHDVEEEEDLRAKLGNEAFRSWDQERLFQQFNLHDISLSANESDSLYSLAANLRQRLRDLEKSRQENQIDQAAYNSAQAKAQSDFESQLRTLLGEERYSTLRGTDPTVGELRRNLRGVNLDEQQFATLLHAQQQWDTARTQLEQQLTETGDTNLQQQIDTLAQKHNQTFENILGTNGLALYEKQQDSRYLELEKNAARWGLDDSRIDYIYAAIQTYENEAADYQRKVREMESSGMKLDSDDIDQPWMKYKNEMAQYVRTNLTEAQYQAITRNQILPFAGQ